MQSASQETDFFVQKRGTSSAKSIHYWRRTAAFAVILNLRERPINITMVVECSESMQNPFMIRRPGREERCDVR